VIILKPYATVISVEQVMALYNYAGQHEDELTFTKGSIINVQSKDDPDWWKGELNGVEGVFPSNYVTPITDASSPVQTTCKYKCTL
jgi:hypothetical protein